MKLVQRLKGIRKSLGLNQSDFAQHLGITQTAYSMIENGWEDGISYQSLEDVENQQISAIELTQFYDIPENVRNKYELGQGLKTMVKSFLQKKRLSSDSLFLPK